MTAPSATPPAPGKNQPCPCGSGKKYKNCCLSSAVLRESGVAALFAREDALTRSILLWARQRLGPEQRSIPSALALPGAHIGHFITSCALHEIPYQGRPTSASFQDAHPHLTTLEREFLASLRAARTSVWQVKEAEKRRALLVDRFAADERWAATQEHHDFLAPGTLLLGRVGTLAGEAYLESVEIGDFPRAEAEAVLDALRARLADSSGVERLLALLSAWPELHSAFRERRAAEERRLRARPILTDRFSFAAADWGLVDKAVLAFPGADEIFRGEPNLEVVLLDPALPTVGGGDGERGVILLSEDELRGETRSPAQADALRREVEERLGATLRFVAREVEESGTDDGEDEDDQGVDNADNADTVDDVDSDESEDKDDSARG